MEPPEDDRHADDLNQRASIRDAGDQVETKPNQMRRVQHARQRTDRQHDRRKPQGPDGRRTNGLRHVQHVVGHPSCPSEQRKRRKRRRHEQHEKGRPDDGRLGLPIGSTESFRAKFRRRLPHAEIADRGVPDQHVDQCEHPVFGGSERSNHKRRGHQRRAERDGLPARSSTVHRRRREKS